MNNMQQDKQDITRQKQYKKKYNVKHITRQKRCDNRIRCANIKDITKGKIQIRQGSQNETKKTEVQFALHR